MGMSSDDLQDGEKASLNGFFCRAIRDGWERTNWPDLCPYGEARFVGNMFPAANGFGNPALWDPTQGVTLESNVVANPLDGQITAGEMAEDAGASDHYMGTGILSQGSYVPGDYICSVFVRPNGRDYVQLYFSDNNASIYGIFYLSGNGSVSSVSGCTGEITKMPNGFYRIAIRFTSSLQAFTFSTRLYLQSDATTTTYVGDGASGVFIYGYSLNGLTAAGAQANILPWDQEGEQPIDVLFNAWASFPANLRMPTQARYSFNSDGIQFYSNAGTQWYPWTPSLQNSGNILYPSVVFIYYRKECPEFVGDDYSAIATYAIDDVVYFEDSEGVGNFWKCIIATSAGQSPSTTPASWEVLPIPQFLFDFIVHKSYSEWLRVEGQQAKAQLNAQNAEEILLGEMDKLERQQGFTLQTKTQTHLTTQAN